MNSSCPVKNNLNSMGFMSVVKGRDKVRRGDGL